MATLGRADQHDLLRWADTVASRTELPRLIRRLVLETGAGIVSLGFAAGAGSSVGSWDGTARGTGTAPFVPKGLSLLELSVERKVEPKANGDFAKRTTTPDGSPTCNCTYVQVGLRRWAKRQAWAAAKSAVGRWREVRAYGVDDIETWLEDAPVTHAWLSALLGLSPYGILAAETWWTDWCKATSPVLTSGFVLAGREDPVQTLRHRLAGSPQVTTISAQSEEDVLAFMSAFAESEAAADGGYVLARSAIVDDVASWRALRDRQGPLILIPRGEAVKREAAVVANHHAVIPVPGSDQADISLPPLSSAETVAALRAAGVPDSLAEEVGRLARLSLMAARRRIAVNPALHQPPWAQVPVARSARAALLAGRWNERFEPDQRVVASLSESSYEGTREAVEGLASAGDPFVARVDQAMGVVSVVDAWILLRKHLRQEDLDRFSRAVNKVLLEVNPALDLPPDDRWRAGVLGKVRDFSGDLRRGLTTSLALLGIHGEIIQMTGNITGADVAKMLVRGLLAQANHDPTCEVWESLEDILPLLAEAAPDHFLDAVRAGTVGEDALLVRMFTDGGQRHAFAAHSPHTGLLWALERLAWSHDYFGQALALLARLAELDPGGSWSNRPASSLANVLCPWHPDTSADVTARLDAINGLRARFQAVTWPLMLSLLPDPVQGTHFPTSDPHYRDWKPNERAPVMLAEYWTFVDDITNRLIEDAGTDIRRWQELVASLARLSPGGRTKAVVALQAFLNNSEIPDPDRAEVSRTIGGQLRRHRRYADAHWALPTAELDELEEITRQLQPKETAQRHLWLFSEPTPDIGRPEDRGDFHGQEQRLAEMRREAIKEIAEEVGLDGVFAFAEQVSQPWAIGIAVADAGIGDEVTLRRLLSDASQQKTAAAWAYATRCFHLHGWDWANLQLADPPDDPIQTARLLLCTRDFPDAWTRAQALGLQVEEAFWREFGTMGLGLDFPYVSFVAKKLIAVDRVGAALEMLGRYLEFEVFEPELGELIACCLEDLLVTPVEREIRTISEYELQQLFCYLQLGRDHLGLERVGHLEWSFLPALGFDAAPETLHRLMAGNPRFYVEIITAIFRPASGDSEAEVESTDDGGRGINAYRLLSQWHLAPGLQDDGSLDPDALRAWIADAQEELNKADRLDIGEQYIGQVLAWTPTPDEGQWPTEVLRDLFEDMQSEHLETGFAMATFNRRGVTSRGLEDGGGQEAALVARYKAAASKFANQWPRTAAILRGLADSYEADSRREEGSAERFRTGFQT
jgi:hypothetical protein